MYPGVFGGANACSLQWTARAVFVKANERTDGANTMSDAAPPPSRLPLDWIAASLRRERTRAGLSLSELAKRAGIAKSTLSQLEAGGGNPSVETLWALGVALGVPFSALVEPPSPAVEVIRAGEGPTVASERADYVATLLSASPPGARRDIYHLRAEPGARPGVGAAHSGVCGASDRQHGATEGGAAGGGGGTGARGLHDISRGCAARVRGAAARDDVRAGHAARVTWRSGKRQEPHCLAARGSLGTAICSGSKHQAPRPKTQTGVTFSA